MNRSLVAAALLSGLGLLAWACWPERPMPAPPVARAAVSQPPPLPAPRRTELDGLPAALPPSAAGCEPAAPLPPHEESLAIQRALAALAGAAGGGAVLALLLQRPEEGSVAWAAQVHDAALRSGDVAALRWAAGACAGLSDATACRRALLRERLRLEPDNGLHWAEWLHEDPGAADEAWAGLAAAGRWLERPAAWRERLDQALPPTLPAAQRQVLLDRLAQREADWAPPPPSDLAQVCGHWGPGHARGAACRHAATLLQTQADSPRARQQGEQLAQLTKQALPPVSDQTVERLARLGSAPECTR